MWNEEHPKYGWNLDRKEMDFTITERTELFTLDEVFSFIDDTNISEMDACELKSRIVDAVQGIREKVIDEFAEAFDKWIKSDAKRTYYWTEFQVEFMKIAEQMKDEMKNNG